MYRLDAFGICRAGEYGYSLSEPNALVIVGKAQSAIWQLARSIMLRPVHQARVKANWLRIRPSFLP